MDVVEMIKSRVRNSAEGIIRELEHSHGVEGVSIAFKETGKSITVTIKESAVVVEDEPEEDISEATANRLDDVDEQ